MSAARKRVAVVGGGFAGLAAGVALADRGHEVVLLEARRRLGGRAYSFRDAATGSTVDNGQHAMMGCYTHTLAFLERIGAADRVVRQQSLHVEMRDPRRGAAAIRAPGLPAPLHAFGGLLRYRFLTAGERLHALVAGLRVMAMRRNGDPFLAGATVAELLTELGQSRNACQSFWYPVAVATCNEAPERAAAAPFAEVLARGFFGAREDSQFVFARVGLSELYTDAAQRRIVSSGGRVEVGAQVAAVEVRDGRACALSLRDGRRLALDACIVTAPPSATRALLPAEIASQAPWRELEQLGASPIVSVHLWYDRAVLDCEFAGMIGTTTQFAFDRTRLCGTRVADGGSQVSAVISAAHDEETWDNALLTASVVADIESAFPSARGASLVRSVVVKEKHATISCTPAANRLRPAAATPLDNLFLAGDWTATGLPPTIEGAVLSGDRAAELVATRLASVASSVGGVAFEDDGPQQASGGA